MDFHTFSVLLGLFATFVKCHYNNGAQLDNVSKAQLWDVGTYSTSHLEYLFEDVSKFVNMSEIEISLEHAWDGFRNLIDAGQKGLDDGDNDPDIFGNVNPECVDQIRVLVTHLIRLDLWAWKYIDAWGKVQAGLIQGHVTTYGDFRMCSELQHDVANGSGVIHMKGRHCKIVPDFGLYAFPIYGLCLPRACHTEDFREITGKLVKSPMNYQAICQEMKEMDTAAILSICLPMFIFLTALAATAVDYYLQETPRKIDITASTENDQDGQASVDVKEDEQCLLPHKSRVDVIRQKLVIRVLLCFSIKANAPPLFDMSGRPMPNFDCTFGIRVITMLWIVNSHSFLYSFGESVNSSAFLHHLSSKPFSEFFFLGSTSTDSFFAMSGILVSYSLMKTLDSNNGKMKWVNFYVERFLRIAPPYYIILLFSLFSMLYTTDSPSHFRMEQITNVCHKTVWRMVLFVNNFFREKCADWGWYVAVDMQLFLLSPFIIIPLYKKAKLGLLLAALVFIASSAYTVWMCISCRFSPTFNILTVKSEDAPRCNSWNDFYAAPHVRIQTYLIGIITGFILYKRKMVFNVNKIWIFLGWSVAALLFCLIMFGLLPYHLGRPHSGPMGDGVRVAFTAFFRPTWALAFCWLVFACVTGNGGFVNTFLSLPIWKPFARVTYCVFLIHVTLVYYHTVINFKPIYLSSVTVMTFSLSMIFINFIIAFPLSLFFECPFINLKKMLKINF